MTLLSLRAGRLTVDLAPEAGGSLARFALEGVGDLFRPASAAALVSGTGRDTACYPLVPFSNRIAGGRLAFEGKAYRLPNNWPGVAHPLHGEGWAARWAVALDDGRSVELVHEHDGRTGWPFSYRARQRFALTEEALTVRLSIENLEVRPAPAGLGLHPFFVRDEATELECRTTGVWLTDAEILPREHVAVPPRWDFSRRRPVEGTGLDHCFDGWDGRATIRWPDRNMGIEMTAGETFRHLVIYVPEGQSFFCVEPVSHANGAIERTFLPAGDTLSGEITFRPLPL